MSRKTTINILIVFTVVVCLSSCVEPIVMDPAEEMPVFVKCILTRSRYENDNVNPVQSLNLFYAKRPSESVYQSITDASVTVTGGGKSFHFEWNGENWSCTFLPEYETEYFLEITLKDGKKLSARTIFPERRIFNTHVVYTCAMMDPHHPSQRTLARYYSVSGKGEAFIWITPTVPANGISRFCTSHPGADNINVTDEIWEDLPIAEAIRNDYIRMMNVYSDDNSSPVYPKWEYWMQFGSMCIGRPVHKGYIRIYHPDNFDNGIDGLYTHLVTPNDDREWLDHTQECRNAFTIAADNFVYYGYAEGMMATYLIPVRVNFVSKEYDKYLSKIIERGFHVDELAEIYSPDCIYTNIDGGLGIFGSLYYWENI